MKMKSGVLCSAGVSLLIVVTGCIQLPASDGKHPPGEIFDGSGAVGSSADARLRVLAELIGIEGIDLTDTGDVLTGLGSASKYDVYEIPGGAMARGTSIADPFDEYDSFELDASYYIFWIDPLVLADLGHESYIAYVRASDGEITRQTVEFPPVVGGTEYLFFQADRDENRIYRHEYTTLLVDTLAEESAIEIARSASLRVQGEPPGFGGLFVAGTDEARRGADALSSNAIFQQMTGNPAGALTPLRDSQNNRINKEELADALASASEGLGECDKFVLVISSHGSKTGKVRIGEDLISWEELCKLIDENVTAGNICAFFTACYAGLADEVFQAWDAETDKGLAYFLATDSETTAVAVFPLACAAIELQDLPYDEGPIVPSVQEIADAIMNLNVTKEGVTEKICALIEHAAEEGPAALVQELESYKDAAEEAGHPMVGGFEPDDPAPPVDDVFSDPFDPLGGFGTTNDGLGEFDLFDGSLESTDDGETITFEGSMQITNQEGHDPGYFDLFGQQVGHNGNVFTFDVSGTMQVFPEGQVETLMGTVTLTVHDDSVIVDFNGTHTMDQAAVFNLTGSR